LFCELRNSILKKKYLWYYGFKSTQHSLHKILHYYYYYYYYYCCCCCCERGT